MREFDINGIRLAEYQAKLFSKSYDRFNFSSSIFIRRFRYSNILKMLDLNESYNISYTIDEALNDIEEQFGVLNYGKNKYSKESLFWIGYLYRYISYTRDAKTSFLFQIFKHQKLNELYYVYHTQSLENCISNLLEIYNLDEKIFDNNYRFKQVLLKHQDDIS